jgi:aerobic carbon-monoxide dehydrogenase large subunit
MVAERERNATGIGAPLRRREDDRLLRGEGRFVDDSDRAHELHMAVGRCPFPRARIVSIDVAAALELDGVEHVLVGSDVVARTVPISVLRPVPGVPPLPNYAMAADVAVYEGQPVVSVVAVDRYVAEDAIERIVVDYEPLPHVPDVLAAVNGAPVLHDGYVESNLLAVNPQGAGDPEGALAAADVVVEGRFFVNRVSPLPMETRAIAAEWRVGARELVVHHSTQVPHLVRVQLAEALGIDEGDVRVVVGDVGGGFGQKLGIFAEDVLACLHARDTRRPVKWVEDRIEHFRAATHGRESVHDARIGADADGTFRALTDVYATDLGALNSPFGSAQLTSITFPGPYRVRDAHMERRVTVTSKTPIGAYRGYGQPESNFVREVLVDRLARRLGRDPLDLRLQNLLTPDELPWTNAAGAVYDSGDYGHALRLAADAVDYDGIRAAGRGPRPDGRHVGVGLTAFVERTGYDSSKFLARRGSNFGAHESVTLRANRSGGIDLYSGAPAFGQGVETAFAQICAEALGVDASIVSVHVGDTAASPLNTGSFASRTTIAGAGAIAEAAALFKAKVLRIAAATLDGEPTDLAELPLAEIFQIAIVGQGLPPGEEPGLDVTVHWEPPAAAYAYGSAAAVVSVDPVTGDFDIERFVFVHDCGTPVNPLLVAGQVRGALAQGFGAALLEEIVYDPETGQLVNGTMLDYFAPTAADLPQVELLHTEVPSPVTPFGVRGVGEIGTIPAAASIANAVCDALADFGVEIDRLPITPERIWRALR